MGWMPGCPQDPGVFHGDLKPIAIVLHRTYGAWPGDYSVGKQGIFHFLLGKDDGHWVQFAPTEVVQYHCNGANYRAVGIEIEGTNEDTLTAWQSARLGDVLEWLHTEHNIPLDYLDPASVPPASVHVNDGTFHGVISHVSVQTDDGSQQHTDEIAVSAFNAAVAALPTPSPSPRTQGQKMDLLIGQIGKQAAIGGKIPVPANTPLGLLVQGNAIVQSWAGDGVYGLPTAAAGWRAANGTRQAADVILLEPNQLVAVIEAHNKLFA